MGKTQDSTIDYYHRRRTVLLRSIIKRNVAVPLPDEFTPFCQICRRDNDEAQLHVEHPNGDGDHDGKNPGGWQRLYKYEDHFEERRDLWVVCDVCHYLLHRVRGDGHARKLMVGRPHVEEFRDKDPVFTLRKRYREGQLFNSSSE